MFGILAHVRESGQWANKEILPAKFRVYLFLQSVVNRELKTTVDNPTIMRECAMHHGTLADALKALDEHGLIDRHTVHDRVTQKSKRTITLLKWSPVQPDAIERDRQHDSAVLYSNNTSKSPGHPDFSSPRTPEKAEHPASLRVPETCSYGNCEEHGPHDYGAGLRLCDQHTELYFAERRERFDREEAARNAATDSR